MCLYLTLDFAASGNLNSWKSKFNPVLSVIFNKDIMVKTTREHVIN